MTQTGAGWGSGMLGVIIFSGSLPATRVAVGGFSPLFLTSARAVIAALLGAALLLLLRQAWPQRRDLVPLALTAAGVVVGFPLLTALALRHITSAQGERKAQSGFVQKTDAFATDGLVFNPGVVKYE